MSIWNHWFESRKLKSNSRCGVDSVKNHSYKYAVGIILPTTTKVLNYLWIMKQKFYQNNMQIANDNLLIIHA